ncbi:MAG: ABC transporter permease [Desulfobacteraceae bacterium]|nr:ABC transporter permease [Desulfobacteraceae bacterium]
MFKDLRNFIFINTSLILFIIIWQLIALKLDNRVILPDFFEVWKIITNPFEEIIGMGSLASNILVSFVRVFAGYFMAVVTAVPIGIFMGYSKNINRFFNNFFNLFKPVPPLAWVPLVMAWFGVSSFATIAGLETGRWYVYLNNLKFSMIFIIFIGGFYPILTSTIHGVRGVRKILLDSAHVLGASKKDIFLKILIPAAAPSIVNGMRIGLGVSWMCLVSAEMLPGSLSGVGYLITHAYSVARTDIVIAGMISIGATGALLDSIFQAFERRKFKWQKLSK